VVCILPIIDYGPFVNLFWGNFRTRELTAFRVFLYSERLSRQKRDNRFEFVAIIIRNIEFQSAKFIEAPMNNLFQIIRQSWQIAKNNKLLWMFSFSGSLATILFTASSQFSNVDSITAQCC